MPKAEVAYLARCYSFVKFLRKKKKCPTFDLKTLTTTVSDDFRKT